MAAKAATIQNPPTAQTRTMALLLGLLLYGFLLIEFGGIAQLPTVTVCQIATGVSLVAVAIAGVTATDRFWSVQSLYLLVSFVFNIGQVLAVAAGVNLLNPEALAWTGWIYQPEAKTAAVMGSMALLLCALGATLATGSRKPALTEVPLVRARIGEFSFALLTAAILTWFGYCLARANWSPHIFVAAYMDFKKTTDSPFMDIFYWAIIMGIGLLMTCDHRYTKAGLILFVVWGLDAFMLGNRGPVLIAVCVAMAVAAKRGKLRLNLGVAVLLVVALLGAISVVRDLRQYGAANFTKSAQKASPTESLIELGGSLRPTVESIKFAREGGLRYGQTYYAPFERTFLYYLIPGIDRPPAESDMRLANVLIAARVGPIGFSTIAEAYLNFGFWGTQIILFLIGFMLGRMDTWRADVISLCAMMILFQPLLDHVRQSFVPFPIFVSLGIALTLIVGMVVIGARRAAALREAPATS